MNDSCIYPLSLHLFSTGEGLEILYKLMSYGIPVDLIPVTETGNVKTKHLAQWIKVRKAIESGSTHIVECPSMNDVIIRFGKAYMSHPGTVMFRGIMESYYEEHSNAATKEEKVAITWKIVEAVESKGGRFLVWDKGGWWTELKDRAQIRTKVAVSMKDHSKRMQALHNVQSTYSSTYQFERQDWRKRKRDEDGRETVPCCSRAASNAH
jgi:hypothetical protein